MTESTKDAGDELSIAPNYMLSSDEPSSVPDDEASSASDEQPAVTAWSLLREVLETVVLSLVIFLVIRQGVQNYNIEGPSMEPNFYNGQFVLVNKLAYKLGEPERGDVVVFKNPANQDEDYIKRVIGLPGDTVQFSDDHVYINGELLHDDPFINPPTYSRGQEMVKVSPDHLFVMGDNRRNSRDSRDFGVLDEDLLIGKAWIRLWPISEWGRVGHLSLEPGVPYEELE